MKERLTAIRATIEDITNGTYGEDDGPCVVSPQGVELRRVYLIGSIVDQVTGNNNYASITLDDGTGTIRAKSWGQESDLLQKVGTEILALMIGKVREYEGEVYISPEIVREIDDPNIIALHKYERQLAILRYGNEGASTQKPSDKSLLSFDESGKTAGRKSSSSDLMGLAAEIYQFIIDNDNPNGISIKEIAKHFEAKGVDQLQVNMELIELVENEQVVEQEVGVYRPVA